MEDEVEVTASEVAPATAWLEVDDALVASRCRCESRRSKARTSVRGEGRGGSSGRSGASPVLERGRNRRVPVDNKSVAETGKRCLLGSGSGRFGGHGTKPGNLGRRPITVTGGKLSEAKGCPGCSRESIKR